MKTSQLCKCAAVSLDLDQANVIAMQNMTVARSSLRNGQKSNFD